MNASQRLQASIELRQRLLHDCGELIESVARRIARAVSHGHKTLLFGNGGSAADAQHIAAEFVGRFEVERAPLPAIALTTDSSILTAVANDYGYDEVFARQVLALGAPGDIAVGISTSGRSANVCKGLVAARARGMATIGLTGAAGRDVEANSDYCIRVPSDNTALIQECHISLGHIFCAEVDRQVELGWGESEGKGTSSQGVLDLAGATDQVTQWRAAGLSVAWTNGCFDILHVGHLDSLELAKRQADKLIVGINSDASVRRLKGEGRPLVTADERARLVASLAPVDAVVVFDEDDPRQVLGLLRPDVHCKGDEYQEKTMVERAVVEGYGGRIEFLKMTPNRGSTALRNLLRGT